jgi:hypothetical protein
MTTGLKQSSNVAIASLLIDTDRGTVPVQDALVDTGGSKNLASQHLLTDIRLTESYGNEPIRMVTVNGLSPDYTHQGELHTTDENGIPLVILCYVQEQPIMGHDTFILLSNNTIVSTQNNSAHNAPQEPVGFDAFQLAMYAAFDEKARHLQYTGERLRPTAKRRHAMNPILVTEAWLLSSEWDPAFMSEIALHGLLDRTKADEQDEDAMDMTVINGIRMSKYDIRALRVGLKVTPELRNALIEFNKGFTGENSSSRTILIP